MDIVLIPGLWLDGEAWDGVVTHLEDDGHRAIPLTLPGQGDGASTATYEEQVRAVVAAVDDATAPVMVVGHSAACTLAWVAADARPDDVGLVVLIGGFPAADGETYADIFEPVDGEVAFPGWDPFDGEDAADLDEEARDRFAAAAHPVPSAVTQGRVRLGDARRHGTPVVLVCPEFTPDQARAWFDDGQVPELEQVEDLRMVDIESGHWPMLTRPGELASLLVEAVPGG